MFLVIKVLKACCVQDRAAAHIAALARMRESAEAAEAACSTAEHGSSVCTPPEQPTPSSAAAPAPPAPKPPTAPPMIQESASVSLKRAGAVMLGTLSELRWPYEAIAACTAPTEDNEDKKEGSECLDDGQWHTAHGTVVQGSCLRVGAGEEGETWVPCHEDVLASECPVDVMCVQAKALMLHRAFAEGLSDVRQVLKALRGLCVTPPTPAAPFVLSGSQPCNQQNQHPVSQGPVCVIGPGTAASTLIPPSFLSQQKPSDSCSQVHENASSEFLKLCGVPENPQQAVSVLGPWPAAASFWSNTTVTFLGTGSSEPSKYRGPSAVLLEVR